jgi:hypothetical protein
MKRWLSSARRRRVAGVSAGALLALLVAPGCASLGVGAEPIEVNLSGLTPLPSNAFEHRLRVVLRLRNPNPREYRIDGVRFQLDVNGQRLATGQEAVEATLPRLGEVVIPVTTTTTLLDVVNQIVSFGRRSEAQQRHFDYRLRGRLFLAGSWGGIDFDRSGSTAEWGGAAPVR